MEKELDKDAVDFFLELGMNFNYVLYYICFDEKLFLK